jgi:hypothetical protein
MPCLSGVRERRPVHRGVGLDIQIFCQKQRAENRGCLVRRFCTVIRLTPHAYALLTTTTSHVPDRLSRSGVRRHLALRHPRRPALHSVHDCQLPANPVRVIPLGGDSRRVPRRLPRQAANRRQYRCRESCWHRRCAASTLDVVRHARNRGRPVQSTVVLDGPRRPRRPGYRPHLLVGRAGRRARSQSRRLGWPTRRTPAAR